MLNYSSISELSFDASYPLHNSQQPFRVGGARAGPQPTDLCFKCYQTDHWKSKCPLTLLLSSKAVAGPLQTKGDDVKYQTILGSELEGFPQKTEKCSDENKC